jgi:hypothetical protein
MKAYRVVVPGYDDHFIFAESRSKAMNQAVTALREACSVTYRQALSIIRVLRAPEYDNQFKKEGWFTPHYEI